MNIDAFAFSGDEIFKHLKKILSSSRFLKKQGLGNEIPFFICPFNPKHSVAVAQKTQLLIHGLRAQNIHILEINLYDLATTILKERGIFQQIISYEKDYSKDQLKELLQNVLDSETHLIPAIVSKMESAHFDILFVTGIGEVFPYIRSHSVLNNLQSTAKDKPTVFFFPGEYSHSLESGASLDLFGKLHNDKYYRAFNIFHCEA